jgi:FixJ family two-component response regulator
VEAKVGRRFVHIVDDNATFRKTIEGLLRQFGYEVSTYPSAQHLLDRMPSDDVPSCILLDVRMPGMSGPELQERLVQLSSTLPIIFLSGHTDIATTVRTMKAGGDDFLIKPISSDGLLRSVEGAITRHNGLLSLKQMRDAALSRIAKLTPRERQVFELVIRGKTTKEIANALGATERTMKAHRHGVMTKMQVRSLAELVSLAERVGVLVSDDGRQMN